MLLLGPVASVAHLRRCVASKDLEMRSRLSSDDENAARQEDYSLASSRTEYSRPIPSLSGREVFRPNQEHGATGQALPRLRSARGHHRDISRPSTTPGIRTGPAVPFGHNRTMRPLQTRVDVSYTISTVMWSCFCQCSRFWLSHAPRAETDGIDFPRFDQAEVPPRQCWLLTSTFLSLVPSTPKRPSFLTTCLVHLGV